MLLAQGGRVRTASACARNYGCVRPRLCVTAAACDSCCSRTLLHATATAACELPCMPCQTASAAGSNTQPQGVGPGFTGIYRGFTGNLQGLTGDSQGFTGALQEIYRGLQGIHKDLQGIRRSVQTGCAHDAAVNQDGLLVWVRAHRYEYSPVPPEGTTMGTGSAKRALDSLMIPAVPQALPPPPAYPSSRLPTNAYLLLLVGHALHHVGAGVRRRFVRERADGDDNGACASGGHSLEVRQAERAAAAREHLQRQGDDGSGGGGGEHRSTHTIEVQGLLPVLTCYHNRCSHLHAECDEVLQNGQSRTKGGACRYRRALKSKRSSGGMYMTAAPVCKPMAQSNEEDWGIGPGR
eukprot:362645-Chlamydomonas_euryale.AAC.2